MWRNRVGKHTHSISFENTIAAPQNFLSFIKIKIQKIFSTFTPCFLKD